MDEQARQREQSGRKRQARRLWFSFVDFSEAQSRFEALSRLLASSGKSVVRIPEEVLSAAVFDAAVISIAKPFTTNEDGKLSTKKLERDRWKSKLSTDESDLLKDLLDTRHRRAAHSEDRVPDRINFSIDAPGDAAIWGEIRERIPLDKVKASERLAERLKGLAIMDFHKAIRGIDVDSSF